MNQTLTKAQKILGEKMELGRPLYQHELAALLGIPSGRRTIMNWNANGIPPMAKTLLQLLINTPTVYWPQKTA